MAASLKTASDLPALRLLGLRGRRVIEGHGLGLRPGHSGRLTAFGARHGIDRGSLIDPEVPATY